MRKTYEEKLREHGYGDAFDEAIADLGFEPDLTSRQYFAKMFVAGVEAESGKMFDMVKDMVATMIKKPSDVPPGN